MINHPNRSKEKTGAPKITATVVKKVLKLVDAGLVHGIGNPKPGEMCVEAAVCYALGLPHGDDPKCVAPALRSLKIRLNDSNWSSNLARAAGLRRLAVIQLGSVGFLDESEFIKRVLAAVIRKLFPPAFRAVASVQKDDAKKAKWSDLASRCEAAPEQMTAREARQFFVEFRDTAAAADAADAYAAAADAAAAAAYAADAYAYAYAADAAAAAAAAAAAYAYAYAYAAAAADAADAASQNIAKARDGALSRFAEEVVQILVAMGVPGAKWLELTEAA